MERISMNDEKDIINPLRGMSVYGWHFEQNVYSIDSPCIRGIKAGGGSGNIPKVIIGEFKDMCFDNYECEGQINIFDLSTPRYKITKPIRLIELFGGIGSQAMSLRNIGANFEHYRLVEFDKYPIASYNAIHGTNFEPTDITKINGSYLGIEETDKYCYILCYSFPCQDLSVAGLGAGMSKGSGTRSGLLWEVERLLNECEHLPQILLMENVPQVHGKKNVADFEKWIDFLKSKGYTNYWQDLNAKNYGVAQNRNRCFMVSIHGNYTYEFPKTIPLTKTMKDYLEDVVDEKYYINSEKALKLIETLQENGTIPRKEKPIYGGIEEHGKF